MIPATTRIAKSNTRRPAPFATDEDALTTSSSTNNSNSNMTFGKKRFFPSSSASSQVTNEQTNQNQFIPHLSEAKYDPEHPDADWAGYVHRSQAQAKRHFESHTKDVSVSFFLLLLQMSVGR